METNHNELICELRDQADVLGPGTECDMLRRAADVIEQQDEEIAIMATEHTAQLMTVDDIRHATGRIVWIEEADRHLQPTIVFYALADEIGFLGSAGRRIPGFYNTTHECAWRCWTQEPTRAQREGAKWGA